MSPFAPPPEREDSQIYEKDIALPSSDLTTVVYGCGWSLTRGAVYFTRDGVLVGDAFTSPLLAREPVRSEARFAPAVECFARGTKVSFNFGGQPMRFVPPWLAEAGDASAAALGARLEVRHPPLV